LNALIHEEAKEQENINKKKIIKINPEAVE